MPGSQFESGSFSSFGAMTSQIFPLKPGERVIKFGYSPLENGFNFDKNEFMSRMTQH